MRLIGCFRCSLTVYERLCPCTEFQIGDFSRWSYSMSWSNQPPRSVTTPSSLSDFAKEKYVSCLSISLAVLVLVYSVKIVVFLFERSTRMSSNASQAFAWQTLGPLLVGLILQIFISGMCYLSAAQVWSSRTSALSRNMKIVLGVTLALNTISLGSSVTDLLLWATTQQRDEASLVSCTIPDACTTI